MDWKKRLQDVQQHLAREQMDGWLLYDFCGQNLLARDFLKLSKETFTTRRFFYWIPAHGAPVKILHQIEPHVLASLPGETQIYLTWQSLENALKATLKGVKSVAMEFSERNAVPYISKVDAGTVDLVRSCGVEVVSSASFLQYYTCVLDQMQLNMHLEAADFLNRTANAVWEMLSYALHRGKKINEYQVRQFICKEMHEQGFVTEGLPICAVNSHSADPHFEPLQEGSKEIQKEDFILIDLWCKKNQPQAVYADITRVAVASEKATSKQAEIFSIVRKAQQTATDFVKNKYAKKEKVLGFEVDQVCRKVIDEAGYANFFTHRTGHNIYTKDHGPGAHLDSLETQDQRELIPNTCFSIEPGIYLPNQFGVRLEYDVFLNSDHSLRVTGGVQEQIQCLY